MGWGFLGKIASYIPLVGGLVDAGVKVVDEIRSDPKLKLNKLKEINAESERRHNEAMKQMNDMQKEHDADFRKREEAVNERIRIQKEENEKIIGQMNRTAAEQNGKYDEEVTKMNDEHSNKMKEMRSENKDARDKAENEHRLKMGVLELEHRKEKMESEKKLAEAKKDGLEKIAVAEQEKDEIAKERNEELEEYMQISKKFEAAHQRNVEEIRKRKNSIRQENMKLRKEQLALENKEKLEVSHMLYLDVINAQTIENSRNVIQKFREITDHITPVGTSLKHIEDVCFPDHGEEPEIIPGDVEEELKSIRAAVNNFKYKEKMFHQYLINTNLTDRRLFDVCSNMIKDMNKTMNQDKLSALNVHLPKAITDNNVKVIKHYGKAAKELRAQFSNLENSLTDGVQHLRQNHLPFAANGEVRAIGQ